MSTVKHQHFLPQFYLKKFSTNNKIDIYDVTTRKIRINQSVEKNARINYFYDIDYDELKPLLSDLFKLHPDAQKREIFKDNQFTEKYLSRVESSISLIIDDLIANPYNIIKDNYWEQIIIFLHDLAYRTEGYRALSSDYNKEIYDKLIDICPEQYLTQFNEKSSKKEQLHRLLSIESLLKTSLMLYENYDFYIGINKSPNINFIISDNPATDIIAKFNDICIPFSSKLAFIFKNKNKEANFFTNDEPTGHIIELSGKSVLIYNIKQFSQAFKYVYGDNSSIQTAINLIKITSILS